MQQQSSQSKHGLARFLTTALVWLTRIGVYLLVSIPLGLAMPFIDQFGPVLKNAALFATLAVIGCFLFGLYQLGRNNAIACWRALYLIPAILLGFVAYCNTGFRWIEDRAMALSEPMDRLNALSNHPPPGPSPEWVARVHRDVKIAKAREEYEVTIARLHKDKSTPFPRSFTPWLYLAAFVFLGIACLPKSRIEDVLARVAPP